MEGAEPDLTLWVLYVREPLTKVTVTLADTSALKAAIDAAKAAKQNVAVSVDGSEIAAKDDLGTLMQKHTAGDTLAITVARDGQMQTVNVTLGEKTASNS